MRPYQQQQILEMFQTLNEVVRELGKQSDLNVVSDLISECLEFIEAVKNFIDGLTGKETLTSKLLTEHAALLEKYKSGEVKKGRLYNQILRIENNAKTELEPDRIEIAFLSYNASMSDSLMSIYLAAKADPNCDAYWVPIPYFQIEADGSLGEEHFEIFGAYPEIECVDWQKYDIEVRHPEIIFTFNGYDEYNLVTRVHPDFLCKRLKDFTDCLVYVPYFVLDSNALPEIYEHFISLPGTWYSDKVILQDEKVCNTYIEVFSKAWGSHYGNPKEKFIALGSAKYDRAINTKRDECDIPPEWKKLIGEKKVVFYNTTISGALRSSEHYLAKMWSTFKAFRERNDMVLWWRPHPLLMQTFSSMRPGQYALYEKLVRMYRSESWGIYDDTSDLHRAIAWSDVYYGDGSSVTELFKVTGKPVFYQGINPTEESPIELLNYFWFHITDIFEACGELYAVTYNDYLFKLIGRSFKYESEIAISPNLPRHRCYSTQVVDGDKVMFIPHNDNQISVYNIKTKEYRVYPLELKDEYQAPVNNETRSFFDGIINKNKLFLLPGGYRNIVAFHLDTKETEHCLDLLKLFPKEKMDRVGYGWTWLNENTILLVSLNTNGVLEFNLDTYAFKVHRIGPQNYSFHNIYKYGENCFLIGGQPFVMKWNYESGTIETYDKLPDNFKVARKQHWVFFSNNIKPYKNKLILLGGYTNMVLEFDLDTCEFRKLDVFDEIMNRKLKAESNDDLSFSTCNYMSDNFLYFVHKNEVLYRYDFEAQTMEEICDLVPAFNTDDYSAINNNFIASMLKGENSQVKTDDIDKFQDGHSGERIYKYVKAKVLRK